MQDVVSNEYLARILYEFHPVRSLSSFLDRTGAREGEV